MADEINSRPYNVTYVNQKIIQRFEASKAIIFGQNIVAGSRISGLGKGLDAIPNVQAINTPNAENTLMGFGMGLMIQGIDSAFIMKQHDFALLGLDQLTNTINLIRNQRLTASFLILMVVVDSGFEGPQASLNNLSEFYSFSRSPVYYLSTRNNIDSAFKESQKPGLHIMALSQKNMKRPVYDYESAKFQTELGFIECHGNNSDFLVVNYGLDVDYFCEITELAESLQLVVDILHINQYGAELSESSFARLAKYKRIILLDSSKSLVTESRNLALNLSQRRIKVDFFPRTPTTSWGEVFADVHETTPHDIVTTLMEAINERY